MLAVQLNCTCQTCIILNLVCNNTTFPTAVCRLGKRRDSEWSASKKLDAPKFLRVFGNSCLDSTYLTRQVSVRNQSFGSNEIPTGLFLASGTFDRQNPSESKRQLRLEPLKGEGLFPFDEDTANQTETNPTVRLRVAGRYRVILIVSLSFQNYRTQPSAGVCGR